MSISQEVPGVWKFSCHLYILLISIDTSKLDILPDISHINYHHKQDNIQNLIWHQPQMKKNISKGCQILIAYMRIRVKIKLQQSLVILPKIVYYYSCSMIWHQIKLHSKKKKEKCVNSLKKEYDKNNWYWYSFPWRRLETRNFKLEHKQEIYPWENRPSLTYPQKLVQGKKSA